jgi:ATP adenylyltransferase
MARLKKVLKPQAFNTGMNIGKFAGAGIAQHIHLHIVPRWAGDTNFMPVIAGTKIISQSLSELYKQLVAKLK